MEEMNLSEYKEHVVYNLVNATAEKRDCLCLLSRILSDMTYIVTLQPVQPEVSWMYAMWNKMYN
jgi:hypothetical protein